MEVPIASGSEEWIALQKCESVQRTCASSELVTDTVSPFSIASPLPSSSAACSATATSLPPDSACCLDWLLSLRVDKVPFQLSGLDMRSAAQQSTSRR